MNRLVACGKQDGYSIVNQEPRIIRDRDVSRAENLMDIARRAKPENPYNEFIADNHLAAERKGSCQN
jgi:hypothetical protein